MSQPKISSISQAAFYLLSCLRQQKPYSAPLFLGSTFFLFFFFMASGHKKNTLNDKEGLIFRLTSLWLSSLRKHNSSPQNSPGTHTTNTSSGCPNRSKFQIFFPLGQWDSQMIRKNCMSFSICLLLGYSAFLMCCFRSIRCFEAIGLWNVRLT